MESFPPGVFLKGGAGMENEQLVARIRAGEDVAENMSLLYVRNKGMIAKMAGKYQGRAELDDLMQEGYIGLCSAVDAYDSEGGASFLHYALFWVRQAMQRYLENCGSCIRIPASQLYKVRKYEKLKRQYLQEFGREPQDWELCRLLEVSYSALQQLKKNAEYGRIQSLDIYVGEDGETPLVDLVPDSRNDYEEVLDQIEQEQLQATIWPLVDSLPDQQAQVIRMRYQEDATLRETGKRIGVTTEGVRTIQNTALRELRKPSRSNLLRPFLYDERVRSAGMKGTGAHRFNETWTSATEREALIFYD